MDNKNFPWYDDRANIAYPFAKEHPAATPKKSSASKRERIDEFFESIKGDDELFDSSEDVYEGDTDDELGIAEYSPKQIYNYLCRHVWKQDEAKKSAAMLAYNTLVRGIKQNAFFVGPTGCGKTHIWRCLQKLFPEQIVIVDASHLTNDGWKGSTKWRNLLEDPIFRYGENTILVMDEADKFLAPKFSEGENVSRTVASEGLKLLEGTNLDIVSNKVTYSIDTSKISFILCGAFSSKAEQIAKDKGQRHIGFDRVQTTAKAYDRPLTEMDLMDYGVLPELVGRCQQVVNLQPMTEEDFFRMIDSPCGPVDRVAQQYKVSITISDTRRKELAAMAIDTGLGVRWMENRIRQLLDDALFEDCTRETFTL